MTLVELTNVKGGAVWVNASQLLYICVAGGSNGGSMYGDSNVSTSTRLNFVQGTSIEVKEPLTDVLARLGA